MQIKITVSTGWSNGDHIDYLDPPIHWDKLSKKEKEEWIGGAAEEYLHGVCSAYGEILEEIDDR